MKNKITISVVIAARNAEKTLHRALNSIKNQTSKADEIIIVDDGSTDNTYNVAKEFKNKLPNLKVIRTKGLGISKARNLGNALAKGKYIAVLDADDSFTKDAIKTYKEEISKEDVDLLYGDCIYHNFLGNTFVWKYPLYPTNEKLRRGILSSLVSPFKHSSILYKRDSFLKVGKYNESFPIKVDKDLFLKFINNDMKIRKTKAILSEHYKHKDQISRNRIKGIKILFHIIDIYEDNLLRRITYKTKTLISELGKEILRG